MLKTATIFKDFKIAANADNTAVTFEQNGGKSIKVKNDNFSEQVQILDNDGLTDLFDYKYITFDDSAVFEIKDCIKNGNYTTLFIQYLSNISFDTPDNNFRVDGVSVNTLQRLGLDLNEFLKILGNGATIGRKDFLIFENSVPVVYAVKMRVSELPQNIRYAPSGNGNNVELAAVETLNFNIYSHSPTTAQPLYEPTSSGDFLASENAISLFLIIPPTQGYARLNFGNGQPNYTFSLDSFFNALNTLITDLVLSIEITLLSESSLLYTADNDVFKMDFDISAAGIEIKIPNVVIDEDLALWSFRVIDSSVLPSGSSHISSGFPIIATIAHAFGGYRESYNFIKIDTINQLPYVSFLNFEFLGSLIDCAQLRNDYIYIKRQSQSMRAYIDIERNIYTEIPTTIEYAKSAYSNYEAYQKANIDLLNGQEKAALAQTHEQQRNIKNIEHLQSGVNAATSALWSFGFGNIAGGIGSLVGGATNMAFDEKKFNMKQQNDTANLRLQSTQAHERAAAAVVPSSDIKGSINLTTSIKTVRDNTQASLSLITTNYITANDIQMSQLEKYIFDNSITEKVTNISQITKPTWQTLNKFYQVKICNRSALNTRKDLIIFVED